MLLHMKRSISQIYKIIQQDKWNKWKIARLPHESRGAHAEGSVSTADDRRDSAVCAGLKLAAASCRFPPADRNRFFSSRLACSTVKRNEEVVDDGYGKGRAAPMPTLARARRYCGRHEIHGSWTAIRISSPFLFARARRQRS
ncbi:uncharacterized protein LOC116415158 [Apis florea]|uniref:uncharacterized protein LOC116415158 n=1 Tax=Apis florea TaxID=7463 RepID=UPI0012FF4468|nr:uncharacterized protein LOC116415158 [Apis florea]